MDTFTIGQLARRAGVHVETIRYYERRGLLRDPPRRASRYRQYGAGDVARISAIRRAQGFGFTLREICELLPILSTPRPSCGELVRHAKRKIDELTRKIAELERARASLHELVASCARPAGSRARCARASSLALAD